MPDYNYEIHLVRKNKDGKEELIHVFNGPHYAMMVAPANKLKAELQHLEPTHGDPRAVRLKLTISD
jgi:hypothetical protein